MDPGRYGLHRGWDNNSALEGYNRAHEPNSRIGGPYDDRRFVDGRYSRNAVYPRSTFHRGILERENYPVNNVTSVWSRSRRRNYEEEQEEEEYVFDRDSRRHEKQYMDPYHDADVFHDVEIDSFCEFDKFRDYHDHRYGGRDRSEHGYDDHYYRARSQQDREDSCDRDYEYGRHSYDSDYERGSRREGSWRRRVVFDREDDKRDLSWERDQSPHKRYERSWSHGRGDHARSGSPSCRSRSRSQSQSHRARSYEDGQYDLQDRDAKHRRTNAMAPTATVLVKGLSQDTREEDLYQILAEWGPLRHVRVIKDRISGTSRGFAFVDFPSVGAACAMMDKVGDDGIVIDGRVLYFQYSKPTGCPGGSVGHENSIKLGGHFNHKSIAVASDWMCVICGCVNFARRTSCFQCNEARSDDAPLGDTALPSSTPSLKKVFDSGPTHVLVVRGLDENADEEMLRYEFSKHAPIKDLRLVRDKFTHVSRGFAFVHFHSIDDATKALDATNGTTLEKNGQMLRVAYAKSILGPGSCSSGPSQSSSIAAAAIEAAAFSQQYDAAGWAPKEYNPDEKPATGGEPTAPAAGGVLQSGFVWDEASGYYYDAASGFYYDGNTGLYYDGNSGIWYSFDYQTQQYVPCTGHQDNAASAKPAENSKPPDSSDSRKVVISAPATTNTAVEKVSSLHDAVQAAAVAALAAEKKEKEKSKEIKFASKNSILANKKKMNNVLAKWKQRSHEGQATRVALGDSHHHPSSSILSDERSAAAPQGQAQVAPPKGKLKSETVFPKEKEKPISAVAGGGSESSPIKPRPVSDSSGRTLMGVIRGSTRTIAKSDISTPACPVNGASCPTTIKTPFRTDASALGSYSPAAPVGSKRRFSETPVSSSSFPPKEKEQSQATYRDRAAERRSLYGSTRSVEDDVVLVPEVGFASSRVKKSCLDSMPFPPGVGGRAAGDAPASTPSFEVITADRAIDETNVGNRMLRTMGWHEGSGLGKDGSGMVEPVQAKAVESRAGLGSQQKKPDPTLDAHAGGSYKLLIHKKAAARFRDMS